ncbi:MAG TPA: DUF5996 family protein [Sporichthyaceae bacterium]|jgi:hypothetical protein|nr:DUF5996 family protein [Sporichthyaceae bacterium]
MDSDGLSAPAHAAVWPELTLSTWAGTKDALHLWTQVVGKVRLGLAPMVNHWWQVPLYVSARGLTTSLMPVGDRGLEIAFDFLDHRLRMATTDGRSSEFPLQPGSVAEFYAATVAALAEVGVGVPMLARPVELPVAVPFAQDTVSRPYDRDAAHRFWLVLVQADRLMNVFRSRFRGKVSPVHFFWGSADLAVTRFSGRTAPRHPGGAPNCADWVMQEAYSHELSSCGFWPGGSAEGSFYAYAYPTPVGFAESPVEPTAAFFDHGLGEFLLPYAAVRTATDPDSMVLEFFRSTYTAAADLADWDRAVLEVPTGAWPVTAPVRH